MDGKTLRRSFDTAAQKSAIHMVSAWCASNQTVLGQIVCDDKSNEITTLPNLLELLDIGGAVVVADAMHCQKKTTKTIRKHLYAMTDGAEWIARQYAKQLLLELHVLDYYHLRNHVITAAQTLYGEGTKQSIAWREDMMGYVWNQGSLVMLDHRGN